MKQTAGKAVSLQNADTINPWFIVPETVSAGDRMTFELTVTDQGVTLIHGFRFHYLL
ncbi:MAG: hypothetical protein R2875_11680 [Desulfobacterales bacterium]